MNDAPPMSDAPPMTQEDAVEDQYIKDRFMNGEIFKAKKAAIKEQKSNRRQTRDPGQYQVSEAAKACIKRCSSPDAIQESMVATLGQTRSIRDEFKRMAGVLTGVDGVENRAEELKKAWNVPDPK